MFFLPRFFSKKARNFTIFFFDSLATLSTCRRSANSKRNSLNTALIFHIRSVQFWLAENSVTQLRNLKKFCRSFSWSTCKSRQIKICYWKKIRENANSDQTKDSSCRRGQRTMAEAILEFRFVGIWSKSLPGKFGFSREN